MNTQKQQFEKHHDFDIPILETNFNLSVKLCIIVQNNALTTFIGSKTTLCFKYPTFRSKETVFAENLNFSAAIQVKRVRILAKILFTNEHPAYDIFGL